MRPMGMSRMLVTLAVALLMGLALLAGCGGDGETTTTAAGPTTTAAVPTTTAPSPGTTAGPETTAPAPTSVPVTEPSTTEATTSTTEATTTTTEALSSAETRLPNGDIKAMGFISDVWEHGGVRYLSIDYAEMLSGEEARLAAIDAGVIQPDEDLPNDYFIRNVNPMLREFTVSPAVAITTSTRWEPNDGWEAPCTWEDFIGFWGPGPLPDGDTQLHAVPWWIIRDGSEIYSIDEQYIP